MSNKNSEELIQELQGVCDRYNEARNNGESTAKIMEEFHAVSDKLGLELVKESFLRARTDLVGTRQRNLVLTRGVKQLSRMATNLSKVQKLSAQEASDMSKSVPDESTRAFYKSKAGVHNEVATACQTLSEQCSTLLKE